MKKIAFVFIAAMAVLSFTGCKKKGGIGEAMAKMESFKNDMCKCTDKACAEKVGKAMEEYSKSMGDKGEKMMKEMTDDDKKKSAAIAEEMGKCMMKLMAPAMPEGDKKPEGDKAAPEGDKKMDDKAAAPEGDKKMDDKAAAPEGDKKPEEKK